MVEAVTVRSGLMEALKAARAEVGQAIERAGGGWLEGQLDGVLIEGGER